MPYFHFRAIDPQQQLQTGRLFAASVSLAEQTLNAQHWVVLSLRQDWLSAWQLVCGFGASRGRREQQAFLDWCGQLQALLAAGIGLEDALIDLQTDGPARLHNATRAVLNNVRQGKNLSQALFAASQLPGVHFEQRWLTLIEAGENAGHLASTLAQLVDHLTWDLQQSQHIRNQLLQPLLSGFCVLGATLFLILHLAPQVRPMLAQHPPSLSTQSLFWLSDTYRQFGLELITASLVICALTIAAYLHHSGIRRWLQRTGLRIPVLGQLPLFHDLGLYARSLALLQGNGIPILEAMAFSRETLSDSVIKHALAKAQEHVESGHSLHAAFELAGQLLQPVGWPPPVLRLIHQGERTGRLPEALKQIGEHLQQRRRALIQQQQALLQPLVTVFSGALLAWVALALLGPFYEQLGRAW